MRQTLRYVYVLAIENQNSIGVVIRIHPDNAETDSSTGKRARVDLAPRNGWIGASTCDGLAARVERQVADQLAAIREISSGDGPAPKAAVHGS